jgi:hypothetical protein
MKARKTSLVHHHHHLPRGLCCVVLPGGDITGYIPGAFLKPVPTDQNRTSHNFVRNPDSRRAGTGFPENRLTAIPRTFGPVVLVVDGRPDGRIYVVKSRRTIEIKSGTKGNGIERSVFIRFIPCRDERKLPARFYVIPFIRSPIVIFSIGLSVPDLEIDLSVAFQSLAIISSNGRLIGGLIGVS